MSKIAPVGAKDIALDRLMTSDANVRRIKAEISVEDLAEDIACRGLLQSLSVRPVPDGDGAETGKFAVSAGGRRLAGLKLLVKQKRLHEHARSLHRENGWDRGRRFSRREYDARSSASARSIPGEERER